MAMKVAISALVFFCVCAQVRAADPPYGKLSVKGTKLVGSNGEAVALHGMSLFWSQWSEGSVFYNADTVRALKCSWNANVVRAAMGVDQGGYLSNPSLEQQKVEAVIDAAIAEGIYVIVDWHDHNAESHADQAVEFFKKISQKYGNQPHIIYETYNEPLQVSWTGTLKPYHERVVQAIRANDPDNVIILGTPTWSQDVDVAAQSPVSGSNLMYTLHYYAATHKQSLRDKAQSALNQGIAIFVTEYGTVDASGGGSVDTQSSNEWWSFLDNNQISYANWAIDNKAEAAAALTPGSTAQQVGDDSRLTQSGQFVKSKLKGQNNGLSCSGTGGGGNNGGGSQTTKKTTVKTTTRAVRTTAAPGNGGGNNGGGGSDGDLSVSFERVNGWDGGAQYKVVFKNNDDADVCGVNFDLDLPNTLQLNNFWNFEQAGDQYALPGWVRITANGGVFQDAGAVFSGSGNPSARIVSTRKC